ncbi:MAG TPA: hypothetical protein VIK01_21210 [Polyangiaceae bacterium]
MKRSVVVPAVLGLLLGVPRSATASEWAFSLSWDAPDECPDAPTVGHDVDEVLGDANFGPLAVHASGTVSRTTDARYAVALDLDTGAAVTTRPTSNATGAAVESTRRSVHSS